MTVKPYFLPEDGSSTFFWNFNKCMPRYTASQAPSCEFHNLVGHDAVYLVKRNQLLPPSGNRQTWLASRTQSSRFLTFIQRLAAVQLNSAVFWTTTKLVLALFVRNAVLRWCRFTVRAPRTKRKNSGCPLGQLFTSWTLHLIARVAICRLGRRLVQQLPGW
jgi:hypothetical protein